MPSDKACRAYFSIWMKKNSLQSKYHESSKFLTQKMIFKQWLSIFWEINLDCAIERILETTEKVRHEIIGQTLDCLIRKISVAPSCQINLYLHYWNSSTTSRLFNKAISGLIRFWRLWRIEDRRARAHTKLSTHVSWQKFSKHLLFFCLML